MNIIKRKKKILGEWYEYALINENGITLSKIIGKKIPELLKHELYLLECLVQYTDVKSKEEIFYNNYVLLDENNEILISDIINYFITDSYWIILELDGMSKSWKKFKKRKADVIYCIIDNHGKIKVGPTNIIIKYIPCINKITVGNDVFKMHHSHEDYSEVMELIPNNTYIINKGGHKGLIYGFAYYSSKNKYWHCYHQFKLLPENYQIIKAYKTFIEELFILKLDNKFTFYISKPQSSIIENKLFSRRFKNINIVKNKFVLMDIGFLCINEDDSLEFFNGFHDFELLNTSNIEDSSAVINDIISSNYECINGTKSNYFDLVSCF
jgi:hypothetical protein